MHSNHDKPKTSGELLTSFGINTPRSSVTQIKPSTSHFGDAPTKTHNLNGKIIQEVLQYLQIFCEKNKKSEADMQNMMIKMADEKARLDYNAHGGLYAKLECPWMTTSQADVDKANKLGRTLYERGIIKNIFFYNDMKDYINKYVKAKYQGPANGNFPLKILNALFELLQFNSLPAQAHIYSDAHRDQLGDNVRSVNEQIDTIKRDIKEGMDGLKAIKLKMGTTQLTDMSRLLTSILNMTDQSKEVVKDDISRQNLAKRKAIEKDEKTDEIKAAEQAAKQAALMANEDLQQKREAIRETMEALNNPSNSIQIDSAYLSVIEIAIAEYESANVAKLTKLSDDDPGYKRVKTLTEKFTVIGELLQFNMQDVIDAKFKDLQNFVNRVKSGKDYSSFHIKGRKGGLDTILNNKIHAAIELGLIQTDVPRESISTVVQAESSPAASSTADDKKEAQKVRALASRFSDKPLLDFDKVKQEIIHLLNFLYIFSEKNTTTKMAIQKIIDNMNKQEQRFNQIGGLLEKGNHNWLELNPTEKMELKKGGINDIFQYDAIIKFANDNVKSKYLDVKDKNEIVVHKLIEACFAVIHTASLPYDASQYADDNVASWTPTEASFPTLKNAVYTPVEILTQAKKQKRTTQQNELVEGLVNLSNIYPEIAAARNNMRIVDSVDKKKVDKIEFANEALRLEIQLMTQPVNESSTVNVNQDYIKIIVKAIEQYREMNAVKLSTQKVKDSAYKRVNELTFKVKELQKAVNANNQAETTEKFAELSTFVDAIVSGKDYTSLHRRRAEGLDAILEKKLIAAKELQLIGDHTALGNTKRFTFK